MKNTLLFSLFISLAVFSQEPMLELELFVNGLNSPLELKHAGDDRLFVLEQDGRIKVINADGTVNPTNFLDLSANISSGGERGLLGLAFHPEYANNGFFYVYYTNLSGDSQISRFSVSADPNIADPASELEMLTINQPFSNHNGGHIAFGPDDMLYIAVGDGGSGGDPNNFSQNLGTLLGKILRLDVDLPAPYIPADNPFIDNTAAQNEIWAYGVRNPWKFSFDSQTGDLWMADVGQGAWEEINRQPSTSAGLNYGWRCYEGNAPFNPTGCPPQSELIFPIAEYSRSGGNCSVTGGYVYRGSQYPVLQGLYFFADLCGNQIGTVDQEGNLEFLGNFGASTITSFGVDVNNEMYVVAFSGGSIYKLKDTNLSIDSNEFASIKMYPNPATSSVSFDFGSTNITDISLIDIKGNLITTYKNHLASTVSLDVSKYSSGFYFIELTSAQGNKKYKKLMIQ